MPVVLSPLQPPPSCPPSSVPASDAPTTLAEALAQAPLQPASVTIAGQQTTLQSIPDLIALQKFYDERDARNSPTLGVGVARFQPKYE